MTETPEESDQLPEEGPAQQVPDDEGDSSESAPRDSSSDDARREGDTPEGGEGQASGNPANAG
jgi:hypothetical protein